MHLYVTVRARASHDERNDCNIAGLFGFVLVHETRMPNASPSDA